MLIYFRLCKIHSDLLWVTTCHSFNVGKLAWVLQHLHKHQGNFVFFIHTYKLLVSLAFVVRFYFFNYLDTLIDMKQMWTATPVDINICHPQLQLFKFRILLFHFPLLLNPSWMLFLRFLVKHHINLLHKSTGWHCCLECVKRLWKISFSGTQLFIFCWDLNWNCWSCGFMLFNMLLCFLNLIYNLKQCWLFSELFQLFPRRYWSFNIFKNIFHFTKGGILL